MSGLSGSGQDAVAVKGPVKVNRRRSAADRQNSLAARVHRWAGLTIGLILAISGLTGSYLAFYPEIEQAAISPLGGSAGIQPESYEEVYQAFTAVGPPEQGRWNIEIPPEGGVITARFSERGNPNRMVSLDPVSLEVVRDVHWGSTVSTWIYELHYRLLMGRSGGTVMGILGLAVLAMIFAGIVLWWRSGRTARSRLKYDRRGTGERKLYDFHRLLGLGSVVLLVVSVATATAMNLPDQFRPMLMAFSPMEKLPDPQSGASEGRARISIDRAMAIARAELPGTDIRWVQVPNSETAPYLIRFWQKGEPSFRFPKSYFWLDQYDGSVLAVRHGPQGTATNRILDWLYPLHSGQAFGMFGRIVVALLGLVPAILFATGLIRWRRKSARLAAAARHRAR